MNVTHMMKDREDAPWGKNWQLYNRVSHMIDDMVSQKLCGQLVNYALCEQKNSEQIGKKIVTGV